MILINDVIGNQGVLGNIEDYDYLVQYAEKKKKKNILWLFREGASIITQVLLKEIRDINTGIKNERLKQILTNFEEAVNKCDTVIIITQG